MQLHKKFYSVVEEKESRFGATALGPVLATLLSGWTEMEWGKIVAFAATIQVWEIQKEKEAMLGKLRFQVSQGSLKSKESSLK